MWARITIRVLGLFIVQFWQAECAVSNLDAKPWGCGQYPLHLIDHLLACLSLSPATKLPSCTPGKARPE